ncbi:hypothetical protein AB205_0100090 [Aquarana catesbeiana]|uniref:Adiponectin receptor protein 2 n=1 Tax=Aquarana catesbeiana TaxID=8400 RepID=A0A2G9R8J2_AQUCT|nr:hypothetical protein AB205_0100090 [Aquarana catesbeiana]
MSVHPQDKSEECDSIEEPVQEDEGFMGMAPLLQAHHAMERVEEFVCKVWEGRWRVIPHDVLPDWLKDNDYLLHGHRPPMPSFRACFKSIFRIHTETGNIWTHLLGVFVGLGLSGIIPTLHFVIAEGFLKAATMGQIGWLILMASLYITGAALYAARIPERFFPGNFTPTSCSMCSSWLELSSTYTESPTSRNSASQSVVVAQPKRCCKEPDRHEGGNAIQSKNNLPHRGGREQFLTQPCKGAEVKWRQTHKCPDKLWN